MCLLETAWILQHDASIISLPRQDLSYDNDNRNANEEGRNSGGSAPRPDI